MTEAVLKGILGRQQGGQDRGDQKTQDDDHPHQGNEILGEAAEDLPDPAFFRRDRLGHFVPRIDHRPSLPPNGQVA